MMKWQSVLVLNLMGHFVLIAMVSILSGIVQGAIRHDGYDGADNFDFSLHILDVMDGLATIIDVGETEIIIDGGINRNDLADYLSATGIVEGSIELVVLSHSHVNRYNGLIRVFQDYNINEYWDSGYGTSSAYVRFLKNTVEQSIDTHIVSPLSKAEEPQYCPPTIETQKQQSFSVDHIPNVSFTILSADNDPPGKTETYRTNNSSIVLMVEINGVRLLFTGDISSRLSDKSSSWSVESELVSLEKKIPGILKADVLIAPYGGSVLSNSQGFIEAVSPTYVVFSANPRFNHPSSSIVARYARIRSKVLTTGLHSEARRDHIIIHGNRYGQLSAEYARTSIQGKVFWEGSVHTPIGMKKVTVETFTDQVNKIRRSLEGRKVEGLWDPNKPDKTFAGADLSGIALHGRYDLSGLDFSSCDLSGAILPSIDIHSADLEYVDLIYADLSHSVLSDANLLHADLKYVSLKDADVNDCDLRYTDLSNSDLSGSHLIGTRLSEAILSGASWSYASLESAPGSGPNFVQLVLAEDLWTLKYMNSPHALVELRKAFRDAGLRQRERELTYAIEEGRRDLSFIERWFRLILFNWTCGYGMKPNRTLKILLALIVSLAPVYFLSMRFAKVAGVWEEQQKGDSDHNNNKCVKKRVEGSTFKLMIMAFYFSILSAFNIGWRDLNVGSWLARLQSHEFTLYGVGWVRSLSGFQSLISVYLMALWVLTYFGRAFG